MGLRVLMLSWRDLHHPEAGGAEKYLVTVAAGLAARGHEVIFRTAAYPGALHDEVIDGVSYVRRGGRLAIYPRALVAHLIGRYDVDVVIDVQNGVPYLSPAVLRTPVVNLVHHVHKEQWPLVFGPRLGRFGWWLESRVAPAVYRSSQYVAVSDSTRRELMGLGVDGHRIDVIHNGTDTRPQDATERSTHPSIIVLGRLVPQKRVEVALQTVAALTVDHPDITLDIVGSGWWQQELERTAAELGVRDRVTFHGHVSEDEKHTLLARAWVHALPSVKEGWGLVVVEAGMHGTPTVAFAEAGGPTDSIVHGRTGLLVDDDDYTAAVRSLLANEQLRHTMSAQVTVWVRQFDWEETVGAWERTLFRVAQRPPASLASRRAPTQNE